MALSEEDVLRRLDEFRSRDKTFLFDEVRGLALHTHNKERVLLESLYSSTQEGHRTIIMFGRNLL